MLEAPADAIAPHAGVQVNWNPNLAAITTWSRMPLKASPNSFSSRMAIGYGEVSKIVTARSTAVPSNEIVS